MAAAAVALPPGFEADGGAGAGPALPPGFELEHPADQPLSPNNVVRAAARGVTGGGVLPYLDATTNALLAPVVEPFMAKGPNSINDAPGETIPQRFRARFNKSLGIIHGEDKAFGEQHPIVDTMAGVAGNIAGLATGAKLIPGAAAAMGMVGPLKQAIPLGATTGAAINVVDAMGRDAELKTRAEEGAAFGALGGPAGKGAGWLFNKARGAVSRAPLVPHTMDVNGRAVPVDQAILSGSAADSTAKQAFIHQAEPKTAQMARDAGEATDVGMRGVAEDFKSDVGPQGASEPHSAKSAAQAVQDALQEGNAASRQNVKAAYDAAGAAPGEYNPSAIQNTPKVIRSALDQDGPDRVVLDQLTPRATQALDYLSTDLGQLRFENAAATPMRMGADGRPVARPITPTVIEQARKNLNNYLKQAVSDGNATDVRAVKRIKSAFDDHITNVINTPGGFSGDAAEVLRLQSAAREAHATHKANYSAGSPQDAAGKVIESIIGKRGAAPLDVEQIIPKLFGSPNNPGGGAQSTLVQRLVKTFGQNTPPVHAMRQGLFSHAADMLPGMTPVGHKAMSDRITKIVNGSVGKALYTPAELARAQAIASAHQRILPVPGTTNPPGSGHVMVRGMKAMAKAALPMLGAAVHGPAGFAAGLAAEKAASAFAARRSAAAAREFFHGKRAPLPESTMPQGFGALGGLTIGERQSR